MTDRLQRLRTTTACMTSAYIATRGVRNPKFCVRVSSQILTKIHDRGRNRCSTLYWINPRPQCNLPLKMTLNSRRRKYTETTSTSGDSASTQYSVFTKITACTVWHNTHWTRLDKCQGPPGSRRPPSLTLFLYILIFQVLGVSHLFYSTADFFVNVLRQSSSNNV